MPSARRQAWSFHAAAGWLCGVQQTHGLVLIPVPMSPSQETWLRTSPTLGPRDRDADARAGGMPLFPPAAVAGTHHRSSDVGFNYRSTDGEGVSNAGGCDAVVQSQENSVPICQEQRLTAAPTVLRPRAAPVGGTWLRVPTSARPTAGAAAGQRRGSLKAGGEPKATSSPVNPCSSSSHSSSSPCGTA